MVRKDEDTTQDTPERARFLLFVLQERRRLERAAEESPEAAEALSALDAELGELLPRMRRLRSPRSPLTKGLYAARAAVVLDTSRQALGALRDSPGLVSPAAEGLLAVASGVSLAKVREAIEENRANPGYLDGPEKAAGQLAGRLLSLSGDRLKGIAGNPGSDGYEQARASAWTEVLERFPAMERDFREFLEDAYIGACGRGSRAKLSELRRLRTETLSLTELALGDDRLNEEIDALLMAAREFAIGTIQAIRDKPQE